MRQRRGEEISFFPQFVRLLITDTVAKPSHRQQETAGIAVASIGCRLGVGFLASSTQSRPRQRANTMKRLCNLLGPLGSGRAGSAAVRCDEHNSASTAPGSSGGGGGGVFRFPARTAGPMPHGRTQRPGSRQKRISGNIPRRAEFSGETTTTPTAPGATAACFESYGTNRGEAAPGVAIYVAGCKLPRRLLINYLSAKQQRPECFAWTLISCPSPY